MGANALGRFPCFARVAMAEYRIYRIGPDGHFTGFEALVCDDDGQAIDKAKQMLDGLDLQIWSGPRFVGSVKHEAKSK